MVSRLVPA